ncbi:MAG: phage major capsid protein [Pseudonocardiaceae bacterium]|nr:phage major capsid protein [Pseudonocardiaceae bacterium]
MSPGVGSVGTLLGRPVYLDATVADSGANDAKAVLFGDFSRYFVRMVRGIRFERSDDFAFDQDLITFRALLRADGDLVDQTGAVKHWVAAAA